MVKRGIKNKGDGPKSEQKNSDTRDTVGVHVGDTTTTEESTAPSGGASIDAHISETNVQSSCPSRTMVNSLREMLRSMLRLGMRTLLTIL